MRRGPPLKRTPLRRRSEKQDEKQSALGRAFEGLILPRDGWACLRCGKERVRLDPAHYLSRNVAPELFLEPDNIATLCRQCHRLTEDHMVPDWNSWKPMRAEWEGRRALSVLPHQTRSQPSGR